MRNVKAGAAVVILLILAAVSWSSREPGLFPPIFLAAAVAVVVGAVAYQEGYKAGQRDLIDPRDLRPLTEDERNRFLMRLTLPPWRRWLGWAAIAIPQLLFWVFMFGASHYGGSGWLFLLATVLSLVLLGIGVGVMEWLWRPFRAAQNEARRARTERK